MLQMVRKPRAVAKPAAAEAQMRHQPMHALVLQQRWWPLGQRKQPAAASSLVKAYTVWGFSRWHLKVLVWRLLGPLAAAIWQKQLATQAMQQHHQQ
jgi:hypothetical protein